MRVESIERIWVDLPLKPVPFRNMVREIPHWSLFEICRVTLSNGIVGVGETMPYYTKCEVTDEAVERASGQHPAEVMWDDSLGMGLQMALFDAVARSMDAPVWALLGEKKRTHCHVGWWAIDMPADDWISECAEAAENGYTTFKTKARSGRSGPPPVRSRAGLLQARSGLQRLRARPNGRSTVVQTAREVPEDRHLGEPDCSGGRRRQPKHPQPSERPDRAPHRPPGV